MENSVESYIDAQPEQAMTYEQFYQNIHGAGSTPYGLSNKFVNKFTDWDTKAREDYDTYLQNLNARNEFKAVQSARQYEKMMDDTKIQRMMKDYEKAGLNPYLLVNDGGVSASSAPSAAKADYKYDRKKQEKNNDYNMRDVALFFIALSRVAAALL